VSGFAEFVRDVEAKTGKQGKPAGKERRLLCPCHHDRDPSLYVREGDNGSPLVTCHVCGAHLPEVCDALGLRVGDYLPARGRDNGRPLIVATYPYRDEEGRLLFEVCRRTDKQFPVRQPDPSAADGWATHIRGVRRVVYRLPELRAEAERGGTAIVVEGEKDADTLARLGLVATSSPFGAGKWNDEYAESFRGLSRVAVIPDDDTEGRDHATMVVRSVVAVVPDVRIVELYERGHSKQDVSDWLATATSNDEREQAKQLLFEMVKATPVGLRDLNESVAEPVGSAGAPWTAEPWPAFRDVAPEQHRYIIEGLLPEGMLVFTAGPPKKGKTWVALATALATATGLALFGEYTVPQARDVLYVALEGSRTGIRARIGALARGLGIDPDGDGLDRLHILYRPGPFDLVDLSAATWLQEEAARVTAALVIVDVLRAAARFNENTAEDFALVRDAVEPLLAAGRSIVLLHHFGKLTETQKERSPGERMAGTGAMYGALDVGFLITRSESGARRMRVEVEARDFAAPDPLGIVILGTGSGEHGGFTYTDTAIITIDPAAADDRDLPEELEQLFADGVWRVLAEIAAKKDGIGANKDDVRDALTGSPDRFVLVEGPRVGRHATAQPWGTTAMLKALDEQEEVARASEPPEPPPPERRQLLLEEQVAPLKGKPPEPPAPSNSKRWLGEPGKPSQTTQNEEDVPPVASWATVEEVTVELQRERGGQVLLRDVLDEIKRRGYDVSGMGDGNPF
jgi:hypothetical protein